MGTSGQSKFTAKLELEKVETSTISHPSLPKNLPPIPNITFKHYFGYLFEGIYQDDTSETEWEVLNGDLLAEKIMGERINENTAFSTPQSTLLSVNDIDSLKKNAKKNDFKGDPKKYIQLMGQIENNIEKDEKAFFVIFDFNYNGKKNIKESVIFIYKEKDNVKNEPSPSPSVSKSFSLSGKLKNFISAVAKVFAKEGKKNIIQVDITRLLNEKPEFARKSIQIKIDSINQVLGEFGFLHQINEELIKIKNLPLPESEEEKIKKVMNNKEIVNVSFEKLMEKTKTALEMRKHGDYSNARDVINKILKANIWDSLDIKSKDYIISLCAPKENKNIISNNNKNNNNNNNNINFQELQSNTEGALLEVKSVIPEGFIILLPSILKTINKNDDPRPPAAIIKGYLDNNGGERLWEKLSLKGQNYLVSLCAPEENKNIISQDMNIIQNEKIIEKEESATEEIKSFLIKTGIKDQSVDNIINKFNEIRSFMKNNTYELKEYYSNDINLFSVRAVVAVFSDDQSLIDGIPLQYRTKDLYRKIGNFCWNTIDKIDENKVHVQYAEKPVILSSYEQKEDLQKREKNFEGIKFYLYNVSGLCQNCGFNVTDTPRSFARQHKELVEKLKTFRDGKFLEDLNEFIPINGETICYIGKYVLGANIVLYDKEGNIPISSYKMGIKNADFPTLCFLHEKGHYQILVPVEANEENLLLREYGQMKEKLNNGLPENINGNEMNHMTNLAKSQFLNNKKGGWLKSYVDWVKYKRYEDSKKK